MLESYSRSSWKCYFERETIKLIYDNLISVMQNKELTVLCGFKKKNVVFSNSIKLLNIYCMSRKSYGLGTKLELWHGSYVKRVLSLVARKDMEEENAHCNVVTPIK